METMVNFFHVNGYIALGAILAFIVIAHVLIRSWRRHKLSNERQRAVARLRSLERKQPPEAARPELTPLHESRSIGLTILVCGRIRNKQRIRNCCCMIQPAVRLLISMFLQNQNQKIHNVCLCWSEPRYSPLAFSNHAR